MGKRLIGSVGLKPGTDTGFDLDEKGQIHGYTDTQFALPVGTNDHVIYADSSADSGLAYGASAKSVLTTAGDLLVASGANTLSRLARGADNYILKMNGTALNWEAESSGVSLSDNNTWTGTNIFNGFISSTPTELTLSSGVVTATRMCHLIDTEGDASTDTMTHMNGYDEGRIVILTTINGARDVTITDEAGGAGTLNMDGDFTLSQVSDTITFCGRLTDGLTFMELSRSNNTA